MTDVGGTAHPSGLPAISPARGEIGCGDVLGVDDDIRVYCAPHPLRHQRHELRAPAGSTVAEIVDLAIAQTGSASKPSDFVVLLHDGHVVPRENWKRVRPKPGTQVAMRPLPGDPISLLVTGLTSILSSIGITGIFAQLLVAGLAIGAKFLLNMLFKPKEKQQENIEPKPSFSITGSRNQASQFAAVPVILGTHRVTPLYASGPYTETIGNDQYLRLLFIVGYGPLDIPQSLIKIGETPIDHFDDVQVQIRQGYSNEGPTTLYPRQMPPELGLGIELLFVDGFHQQTTPDNITEIAIDIVAPQGMLWVDGSGGRHDFGVTISWRYRKVGTVPWTTANNLGIVGQTQDVIRKTARVAVAAGQYEVEVKNAFAEPVLPTTDTLLNTVQWTALRCFRTGEPILFADQVAVIALRIKATSQLNGVVDTLNCVATSIVAKSWNGVAWVDQVTSSRPGDLFRHVLQHTSNKRPVPDSRIDLVSLQLWNNYCGTNGFTYKKPVLSQGSVFDLLQEIAAAGRAMPVFKDGKWSVVWDEQNPPVVQMFTPRNSWGFEASHQYRELPHAFRMRFVNAAKGYVDDERIVYDDGYNSANASKFESFEMPGVTDTTAVWKHGRYHIAQLRLRPATYTLNVDFEGLVLTRNDRVRVQHDVMLVGLGSFRVKSVSGQTVTFDESLLLSSANPEYGFRFRLSNNTYLTRTCSGVDGEFTSITMSGTSTMPVAGDLGAYGISGSETAVYRVLGIEPQENMVHRLTLVDDAPGVSLADTGTIPDYDSGTTQPLDPFELPPTAVFVTDGAYDEGGQFYAYLGVSWLLPRIGQVRSILIEYRNEADGIWRPSPSVTPDVTSTTIRKVNPGLYTVRVRAIFIDGTFSNWCTSAVHNANAALTPPGDVTEFRIATLGDNSTLSWAAVIGAGVTYQVRFSPLLTGVAWNTATPLLPNISATSAQVPTAIGTYLIKAQLPSGIVSLNATSIIASIAALAGFNAVQVLTESPAFAGAKTNVEVVGGELRLLGNATMATWETMSTVISLQAGDGGSDSLGFVFEGTYDFDDTSGLGLDTVVNGTFAADVSWIKDPGVTIAAGVATFTAVANNNIIYQAQALVAGKTYKITYTISGYTAGGVAAFFSLGSFITGPTRTANGTYTEYLTAGTSTIFGFIAVGTTTLNIDNVSMQAVAGSIDLGAIYTSRITAVINAYGLSYSTSLMDSWVRLSDVGALDSTNPDDWEVTLEYRSSPDAVVWSAWQQFVVGDVTARALQFRLKLFGRQADNVDLAYSLTTPSVISLVVNIDMPDRVIGGNDIAVGAAGLTVPFTPPFRSLKGFAINAQNMQTGDYATVTAKTATGFTIIFRNIAGTGVARTFDYNAVGYGKVA